MSRNFFLSAFGFVEERAYAENRRRLLAASTITAHPIELMLHPSPSVAEAMRARAGAEASDEESNMAPRPAPTRVVVPRERCLIRKYPFENGNSVDCGTFWTPSVAELRAVVAAELQTEEAVALLAPYRAARAAAVSSAASSASAPAGGSSKVRGSRAAAASGPISVGHVVGDSRAMHSDPSFRGSVFQAASQFNYLEFPSPGCIPEGGITGYIYDRTQGPACAIACAAGTAFRNYLTPVDAQTLRQAAVAAPAPKQPEVFDVDDVDEGKPKAKATAASPPPSTVSRGQTERLQLNGLRDIEVALGAVGEFFDVRNGYVDSDRRRLTALNAILLGTSSSSSASPSSSASNNPYHMYGNNNEAEPTVDLASPVSECLIDRLRIGVQTDTEVTDLVAAASSSGKPQKRFLVTQTYNSALSVGYSRAGAGLWAPLASIVLAGSYEATLLVGVLAALDALRAQRDGRSGYAMVRPGAHHAYAAPATAAAGNNGSNGTNNAAAHNALATPPPILLTKVGGGVFGNSSAWIIAAMERAFDRVAALDVPLNVLVTHFGDVDSDYRALRRGY